MYDENYGIPRISAADSIDGCFRALADSLEGNQIYHAHKLILEKSTRVAKPDRKLVPDVDKTGEYWVLDPVNVKYLGYIKVIVDKNHNFVYDCHINDD